MPEDIQSRIEEIVFCELNKHDPFSLGSLEKMKGYKDKYKIRERNYRIGLIINTQKKTIICRRIADRKDIYKIFP